MAKQVFLKNEAQKALQKGVNIVADAVGSTFGASGRTAIISHFHSVPPIVSRDGVTVANCIILEDEIENIGAMLVREASSKTMKIAGDGTSQTCVLAQSIINEGLYQMKKGYNPQQVKRGIDKAVAKICESLKTMSDPINSNIQKIEDIATISANNDKVIGKLIADAYQKMGTGGLLLIEESGTLETSIEVVEGSEIQRGYISPEFANNKEKMTFNGEDAYILVTDYELKSVMRDLAPIFGQMEQEGIITRPLLIIAKDFDGEVFGTVLKNVKQKTLNVCLSMVPNQYRVETLEDIAILTGATVISDREGLKMTNVLIEHLGRAAKIIVSENTTTVISGAGGKKKIDEHKNAIKIQMDEIKDEALKEVWRTRLGRLSGSIGVIKIGAATDIEVQEKKFRVDDAKRAVESAIEEGVVVGGGVALLRCRDALWQIHTEGAEIIGVNIIKKACEAPIKKMLDNAGVEKINPTILDSIMVSLNMKQSIFKKVDRGFQNHGYNIKTESFENLLENGVIDPTKVVRSALQNAASVACGVLTSGCLIVEKKVRN